MAQEAVGENSIVVLPTGLGKTAIALHVMAEYLARGTGAVLFLAPTRVLTGQHHTFLKSALTIEDISLITGEDTLPRRKKRWMASVICATPEIARNDFDRGLIHPAQFALVIFDEVHRMVGDYAYSGIAQKFVGRDVRLVGMTATLPSEVAKATEILTRLHASRVAERTEDSPDVRPYIQETDVEWMMVDLPPAMIRMQRDLKQALSGRYEVLRGHGFTNLTAPSLSALLKIRPLVMNRYRRSAVTLFSAIRIHYALNMLEAHGITPFLNFCERTRKKGGPGTAALLDSDPLFSRTIRAAQSEQARGLEHPKILKLREIIESIPGKVLIFASYRDSVDIIHKSLNQMGIPSAILIGKSGETGLKQKKQIETVQKFREGLYRVLVATRVGEEGLDIAEVTHVIFYDNVPSSIRYVQRKGRTGRRDAGKLIVLIAKNTVDETYYWISKRKVKAASTMARKITGILKDNQNMPVQTGIDAFN
ncbi:MAG: DEAD/DEAH box helicase [Nitrosopumilaceae archaeon]|nr:DEAD/DEAH box helicase [Nitrosopumilaceae archaeon]